MFNHGIYGSYRRSPFLEGLAKLGLFIWGGSSFLILAIVPTLINALVFMFCWNFVLYELFNFKMMDYPHSIASCVLLLIVGSYFKSSK